MPTYFKLNEKLHCSVGTSTPSYASWMLHWLKTISAYKDLYFVCLPIVRNESKEFVPADLFDVLFYAHRLRQQIINEAHGIWSWGEPQSYREKLIQNELQGTPEFPLVDFFAYKMNIFMISA